MPLITRFVLADLLSLLKLMLHFTRQILSDLELITIKQAEGVKWIRDWCAFSMKV